MKHLLILFFTFYSFCFFSQTGTEICGNGSNDDPDQLTDCADPDCICPEAFPCVPESEFFQLQQGTTLYSSTAGMAFSPVPGWGNQQQVELNAMGYNIQDGFLYALRNKLNSTASSLNDVNNQYNIRLYRIGSAQFDPASPDNDWEVVGKRGYLNTSNPQHFSDPNFANLNLIPNVIYQTGDFDGQGHLIVGQNTGSNLHSIDLNHDWLGVQDISIDYTNATSGLKTGIVGVSDIAFQPNNGLNAFFGVLVDANQSAGTHLRRFDVNVGLGTGIAEDIIVSPQMGCATDFGAAYATLDGNLYFYCNDNGNGQGEMYKVVPNNSTTWPSNSEFFGPLMVLNDGASCPYSNISIPTGDCCEQVLDILNNWPPPGQTSNLSNTANSAPDNSAIQEQIDDLKDQLKSMEKKTMNVLHQNRPNPFNERTIINYEIHDSYALQASISIFNMNGQLLNTTNIPIEKKGEYIIESNEMEPGMYLYTLIVDGKEIDTKRMILLD